MPLIQPPHSLMAWSWSWSWSWSSTWTAFSSVHFSPLPPAPALLDSYYHRVRPHQVLKVRFPKARALHPFPAIGAGIIKSARRLNQHVETYQQAKGVPAPLVVNDRIVDNQSASFRQGIPCSGDELPLLCEIPVVQDMSHHHRVRARQRVLKEIAGDKLEPLRKTVLGDVGRKDRLHRWQIEACPLQVRMGERNLDCEIALVGSYVDKTAI